LRTKGTRYLGSIGRRQSDLINRGLSPIVEAEINEIIAETVRAGSLRATQDPTGGDPRDRSFLYLRWNATSAKREFSTFVTLRPNLRTDWGRPCEPRRTRHTVVIRSTILARNHARCRYSDPRGVLREKGRVDFGICNNPEFLKRRLSSQGFPGARRKQLSANWIKPVATYSHLSTNT